MRFFFFSLLIFLFTLLKPQETLQPTPSFTDQAPVLGVTAPNSLPPTTQANNNLFKVTKVIDGDTIEIENGLRVRYIGLDTPELGNKPECFGREAFEKNEDLILGQEILLEKDVSETDRYNRLLRHVYLGNTLVGKLLIEEGYARVHSYPPDTRYQEKFLLSQSYAQKEGRGLWKNCPPKKEGKKSQKRTKP